MNDEIREILDRFEKLNVNILYPFEMEASDCKKLLDYITNLQQEVQKKEAMYDSLAVDYRLAQEENERKTNIIKQTRQMLYKRLLDDYDTYTANVVCDFQSDLEEIIRLNGGNDE